LVPRVKQWFRKATSRFEPPTEDGCRLFAQHLHAFGPPGFRREPDPANLAIKNGKQFLENIAQSRRVIEQLLRLATIYREDNSAANMKHKEMLCRINKVRRHLEVLFPYLSPDKPQEQIRFLAQLARELWAETNNGRAPRSKNPNHALCRLLEQALEAIGQDRKRASITEVLRGRRRIR
jgi:hypothetical protein